MKKLIAVLLVLTMVLALGACAKEQTKDETTAKSETTAASNETTAEVSGETTGDFPQEPMSYDQYVAAELDTPVTVECYVQGHQSWWDNKVTVYAQDEMGAYFIYEMACSAEDADKLTPGTKILVQGYKGEWEGEVEIMNATFQFVEGEDTFVAEAKDVTDFIGGEGLINYQNQLVAMKGLEVESVQFKNGEPGDDIYVNVYAGDTQLQLCVEIYLTGEDSDVYVTASSLVPGDIIDIQGYLYWYQGANPHLTSIVLTSAPDVLEGGEELPVEEDPIEEPVEEPIEEPAPEIEGT